MKQTLDEPLPVSTYQANLIHSATVAIIEGVEEEMPSQIEAGQKFLEEALDG